jgi:Leucine-rich repeat (LRR) protein
MIMEAIMTKDLELVKQLEKEIGTELYISRLDRIGESASSAFTVDHNGYVKALAICNVKLTGVPKVLSKFRRLERLALYKTQISDISSLKELKNLKQLDLRYNKISQLPAEFLDLGLEIKWGWDNKDGIYLEGNPMEEPPVEIIKKGNEAIRQYFKSLEENSLKQLEMEIGKKLDQVPL